MLRAAEAANLFFTRKGVDKLGKREDLLSQAREIARAYQQTYTCAESAFGAVAETLNLEGRETVMKAIAGLSGGIANYGTGSCGAIAGAAAAVALSFNSMPTRTPQGLELRDRIFDAISEVVTRFQDKYGGLSCRAVQIKLFGKSFNLRDPKGLEEYRRLNMEEIHIIEDAAQWAVEAILRAQPERTSHEGGQ